jgi:predicted nucleic acid-binding protein
MNHRFFVDTNILVYAYDDSAGPKHAFALSLLREVVQSGAAIISTQVLQELVICLRRKVARPLENKEIRKIVSELLDECFVNNSKIAVAFARDRRPI